MNDLGVHYLDSDCSAMEQLPREFTIKFEPVLVSGKKKVRVSMNGFQVGDVIDDNSRAEDFYRFHDVFHYTFATYLDWSPCTRALMKRKRKSNPLVDEHEDGARATITEEAISLLIFGQAKKLSFLKDGTELPTSLISQIKDMTSQFEVSCRTEDDWKNAIQIGYSLFRQLIEKNGGKIHFNRTYRTSVFEELNSD